MEKKITQRIVGSLVVVAFVIVLLPLLLDKNEAATQLSVAKAPPFPEQPSQKVQNTSSSIYISPETANKINDITVAPITTVNKNNSGQMVVKQIPEQTKSAPINQSAAQPSNSTITNQSTALQSINKVTQLTTPPAKLSATEQATTPPAATTTATAIAQPAVATSTDTDEEDDNDNEISAVKTVAPEHVTQPTKSKTIMKTAALKSKNHKTTLASLTKPAWALQLGSFKSKDNAVNLANRLRTAGYKAFTHEVKSSKGTTQTRVYIGPEFKQASAAKLSAKIEQKMQLHSLVIPYNPLKL